MKDVQVEIYGQVYSIRTGLDPDYIQRLAQTVDERMKALARQTDTVDTRRLAVLAALNLADELHQLQQEAAAQAGAPPAELAERLARCNRLLEAALTGAPTE